MDISRKDQIMKRIHENGSAKTKDLAKEMAVSLDTIRRDMKELEEEGKIEKVYGGAILPQSLSSALNYGSRQIANVDLKREIAKKVVSKVSRNDLVALNAGTTNVFIAQELCYLDFPISVITNNLAAIDVLISKPQIEVIAVGGLINHSEKSTYGSLCYQTYAKYFPDIAFIASNAINIENGISDFRDFEISNIELLSKNSKSVYAVLDSSKFNKRSKTFVLDLNDVDGIFTDNHIDKKLIKEFENAGVSIF